MNSPSEQAKDHIDGTQSQLASSEASAGQAGLAGEFDSSKTQVIQRDAFGQLLPGAPLSGDEGRLSLPGYEFLSILGIGGMGTVYLARQKSLDRYVAIKVIRGDFTSSDIQHNQLQEEAMTMGSLSHPNVLGCYDIIHTDDGLFLVMEYIPGHLTGPMLISHFGVLSEQMLIRILLSVTDGLSYIYSKGYMHRDLKPDNLMIYRDNGQDAKTLEELFHQAGTRVVICDFGIAQSVGAIADPDNIVGSPMYMAPEQFYDLKLLDFRADIYSLACVAYYFLTGCAPFQGKEREELLDYKLTHPVPDPRLKNPEVSQKLSHIIRKMGRIHPADRYQSYQELNDDLEGLLSLDSLFGRAQKKNRWHSFRRILMMILGCLVIVHGGWLFHEYVWKPYFSTVQISLARSLGYWERQDNVSWSVVENDQNESSVFLRGVAKAPLILHQPIATGMSLELKARTFGDGAVRFGFLDDARRPLMYVDWNRGKDETLSVFFLTGQKQRYVFIGEMIQKDRFEWVHFNFEMYGNSIVISANDRMLGVAHFHEHLSSASFFVKMSTAKIVELKDVYRNLSD